MMKTLIGLCLLFASINAFSLGMIGGTNVRQTLQSLFNFPILLFSFESLLIDNCFINVKFVIGEESPTIKKMYILNKTMANENG